MPVEEFAAAFEGDREYQAGLLDKRVEQLSETLRTRARVLRQHNSNAYLYHRSELVVWLKRTVTCWMTR